MALEDILIYIIFLLVIFIIGIIFWIVGENRARRAYNNKMNKLKRSAELRIIS